MKQDKEYPQRSVPQNRALHLFYDWIAEMLNDAGLDMRKTLREDIEISWTPLMVKEYLWRPVQKIKLQKKSTTELTTVEIDIVAEDLIRYLNTKFPGLDLSVEFPSRYNIGYYNEETVGK